MTLEQIRQNLAGISLQATSQQDIIHTGMLSQYDGSQVDFEILCGKNPGLASQCDIEWAEFYKSLLDHFATLEPTERLRQAQGVQLGSQHWDWLKRPFIIKTGAITGFFLWQAQVFRVFV